MPHVPIIYRKAVRGAIKQIKDFFFFLLVSEMHGAVAFVNRSKLNMMNIMQENSTVVGTMKMAENFMMGQKMD